MITDFQDLLVRLPMISLLIYTPLVCYLDVKRRAVDHLLWLPLWVFNIPVAYYFYRVELYPLVAFPLSLLICAFLYVVMRKGIINGADLLYLWAIAIFLIINPFPVPHGIAFIEFFIYLIATMLLTIPVILFLNLRAGRQGLQYPGGIPMMLPISAALILMAVIG